MKFIELETHATGRKVWVDLGVVVTIRRFGDRTQITSNKPDIPEFVNETPEEILNRAEGYSGFLELTHLAGHTIWVNMNLATSLFRCEKSVTGIATKISGIGVVIRVIETPEEIAQAHEWATTWGCRT